MRVVSAKKTSGDHYITKKIPGWKKTPALSIGRNKRGFLSQRMKVFLKPARSIELLVLWAWGRLVKGPR
jgi:hypothetical protein